MVVMGAVVAGAGRAAQEQRLASNGHSSIKTQEAGPIGHGSILAAPSGWRSIGFVAVGIGSSGVRGR